MQMQRKGVKSLYDALFVNERKKNFANTTREKKKKKSDLRAL